MNLSSEYTEDIRSLSGKGAHKRGELFLGLAISAVGLPVAGVVAVARAQGLEKLAGRVHPVFAQVFMILIYLSIGPCLAIPRTASTSFAMLAPLVGTGAGLQLGYSAVFFAAAFLVALRPERLTRWLGRLLCPCLLVLILVLFGGCLLHPLAGQYGTPTPEYTSGAVLQGVLYGYQTMDTLAALNFGAIIALNIQAQGVTRQELAVLLHRYAQYKGLDTATTEENLTSFADAAQVSGYAVSAMNWAVGAGVINGTDSGLAPKATATRAEVAQILMNFDRKF